MIDFYLNSQKAKFSNQGSIRRNSFLKRQASTPD